MISTVLTPAHIQRLHDVSLDILDRIGVELPHPEVLRRFADSGARVDFDRERVGSARPRDALDRAGRQAVHDLRA